MGGETLTRIDSARLAQDPVIRREELRQMEDERQAARFREAARRIASDTARREEQARIEARERYEATLSPAERWLIENRREGGVLGRWATRIGGEAFAAQSALIGIQSEAAFRRRAREWDPWFGTPREGLGAVLAGPVTWLERHGQRLGHVFGLYTPSFDPRMLDDLRRLPPAEQARLLAHENFLLPFFLGETDPVRAARRQRILEAEREITGNPWTFFTHQRGPIVPRNLTGPWADLDGLPEDHARELRERVERQESAAGMGIMGQLGRQRRRAETIEPQLRGAILGGASERELALRRIELETYQAVLEQTNDSMRAHAAAAEAAAAARERLLTQDVRVLQGLEAEVRLWREAGGNLDRYTSLLAERQTRGVFGGERALELRSEAFAGQVAREQQGAEQTAERRLTAIRRLSRGEISEAEFRAWMDPRTAEHRQNLLAQGVAPDSAEFTRQMQMFVSALAESIERLRVFGATTENASAAMQGMRASAAADFLLGLPRGVARDRAEFMLPAVLRRYGPQIHARQMTEQEALDRLLASPEGEDLAGQFEARRRRQARESLEDAQAREELSRLSVGRGPRSMLAAQARAPFERMARMDLANAEIFRQAGAFAERAATTQFDAQVSTQLRFEERRIELMEALTTAMRQGTDAGEAFARQMRVILEIEREQLPVGQAALRLRQLQREELEQASQRLIEIGRRSRLGAERSRALGAAAEAGPGVLALAAAEYDVEVSDEARQIRQAVNAGLLSREEGERRIAAARAERRADVAGGQEFQVRQMLGEYRSRGRLLAANVELGPFAADERRGRVLGQIQAEEMLRRQFPDAAPELAAELRSLVEINRVLEEKDRRLRDIQQGFRQMGSAAAGELERVLIHGGRAADVLRNLGYLAASIGTRMFITRPLEQGFERAFDWAGSAIAGSTFGSVLSAINPLNWFADGGVLPGPVIWAGRGMVIDHPTRFRDGANRQIEAGEAGLEVLMPAVRLPDGSVGVKTTGGAGMTFSPTVNITLPPGAAPADAVQAERMGREIVKAMEGKILDMMLNQMRSGGMLS
jgi:hypothetical protein